MKTKFLHMNHYIPPIVAILLVSTSLVMVGHGASLTGGNHGPISIMNNADFTTCQCLTSGSGGASDPYIIGPWTIMATSGGPAITVDNSTGGIHGFFILSHIAVHGTNTTDGIDLINVNGMGVDSILAANIDGAMDGILLSGTSGVKITGNSINNSLQWGIKLVNSHDNTISFMTLSHNGLLNPASHPVTDLVKATFLQNRFFGGVFLNQSDRNTLSRSELSEDGYAGFVLLRSDSNTITDVHTRYPDYYGGVLQDSSGNIINRISMQTADFVGLLIRGGGSNTIANSTFSANGPIGAETTDFIDPYYISGIYLGWGTMKNTVKFDTSNNGNTGPSLVVDNGTILNPVPSPPQVQNPFNVQSGANAGNDPGTVPANSAFDANIQTKAGMNNVFCGNSFISWALPTNPNQPCISL